MKIPNTLPVTAEQSRAARFQLGLTQADLIQQSDLPGWKLKQFETGRFVPDIPFLEKLREFYVSKGIQFAETVTTTIQVKDEITPLPAAAVTPAPLSQGAAFPFFLCSDLTEAQGGAITERILENDDRCLALLNLPIKHGLFGGLEGPTEAAIRELLGRFAESYMLISRLQGRVFIAQAEGEPRTIAELLAKHYAGSPLVDLSEPRHPGAPVAALAAAEEPAADEEAEEGGEE